MKIMQVLGLPMPKLEEVIHMCMPVFRITTEAHPADLANSHSAWMAGKVEPRIVMTVDLRDIRPGDKITFEGTDDPRKPVEMTVLRNLGED